VNDETTDARDLYKYILLQADESKVWTRLDSMRATHVSGVSFWIGDNFLDFALQDDNCEDVKGVFSLMQKWKIRRKLLKLRQRMERERKYKGMSLPQAYLAKMVEGTLTGEKSEE
jgi:hypothetical protein